MGLPCSYSTIITAWYLNISFGIGVSTLAWKLAMRYYETLLFCRSVGQRSASLTFDIFWLWKCFRPISTLYQYRTFQSGFSGWPRDFVELNCFVGHWVKGQSHKHCLWLQTAYSEGMHFVLTTLVLFVIYLSVTFCLSTHDSSFSQITTFDIDSHVIIWLII